MARQFVMMANARLVLLVVVGVATIASTVQAAKSKPDCSNTYATGTSFSTFENVCAQIMDPKLLAIAHDLSPLARLEVVETCSCALLNHELAWASLMSHESEAFYLSVKEFVDARAKVDPSIQALTKGQMFAGEEGERHFYWDGLDHIIRQATGDTDDDRISLELRKAFARIYYDPNTMKSKFNFEADEMVIHSQKLRVAMSDVCNHIIKEFATPLLPYFSKLSEFSGNERLFFTLAAYNDDLYKLRLNTKICLYLEEKGQLLGGGY